MAKPTKKNPLGKQIKPKLDNPDTIRKLEEAFAFDCSLKEARFYADISSDTYYELLKYKPELSERFEALRQRPIFQARQSVIKSFKDNPEMAMKYLERKNKNEFSTKQEIKEESDTTLTIKREV